MNFAPPKWVTEAAEEALNLVAPNHYSHPRGRIRLREAIKAFYGPQFRNTKRTYQLGRYALDLCERFKLYAIRAKVC